jgi:hypothetical protein
MLFLYTLINAAAHMSNIQSAPPFEAMKYFIVHAFGGFALGYIYLKEKFKGSFSTHLMYNARIHYLYLSHIFINAITSST